MYPFPMQINQNAAEKSLLSPTFTASVERLKATYGRFSPLKYPSVTAEPNATSILAVLNTGSF
jgi:hypothetical protein